MLEELIEATEGASPHTVVGKGSPIYGTVHNQQALKRHCRHPAEEKSDWSARQCFWTLKKKDQKSPAFLRIDLGRANATLLR
jgi:hypothetical protein